MLSSTTPMSTPTVLRRGLALAVCGVAVAVTAACGGSSGSAAISSASPSVTASSSAAPSSDAPAPAGATITITDFMFDAPATVPAGAEVTVKNNDTTAHTVTASGDGGFDVTIQAGKTATFTAPAKAGDFPFVCTFHGNMKGTLTVA